MRSKDLRCRISQPIAHTAPAAHRPKSEGSYPQMVMKRPKGASAQAVDSRTYRWPIAHSLPTTSPEEMPSQMRAAHQRMAMSTHHRKNSRNTPSTVKSIRCDCASMPLKPNDTAKPAIEFWTQPEYHGAVKSPRDCNKSL